MEDHRDNFHLRIFLQQFFDHIHVRVGAPVKDRFDHRDLIFGEDLEQTFTEYTVADKQDGFAGFENGGQDRFVRGGAGTGNDHTVIIVIGIEKLVDLFLGINKHGFKFFAAVANIVMKQ